LPWFIDCIEKINKEVELIIDQRKKFEELNPIDLEEVKKTMAQLKLDIDKEKNKVAIVQKFLKEQRRLRNPLNVKQLIAVHLTDYFPIKGIIRCSGHFETGVYKSGIIKEKKTFTARNTIHFTLNGPVVSHMYGNWKESKFAILIPLESVVDRVINLWPSDTWVFGDLVLPVGSEIILQEKMISRYSKICGKAKLIGLEPNENLSDKVIKRIKERGYTYVGVHGRSWKESFREEELKIFEGFLDKYGNLKWGKHFVDLGKNLNIGVSYKHEWSLWDELEKLAINIYEDYLYGTPVVLKPNYKREQFDYSTPEKEKESLIYTMNLITKYMDELTERSKKFNTKEEKEAYARIKLGFKNLYRYLRRKYQRYWKDIRPDREPNFR